MLVERNLVDEVEMSLSIRQRLVFLKSDKRIEQESEGVGPGYGSCNERGGRGRGAQATGAALVTFVHAQMTTDQE